MKFIPVIKDTCAVMKQMCVMVIYSAVCMVATMKTYQLVGTLLTCFAGSCLFASFPHI